MSFLRAAAPRLALALAALVLVAAPAAAANRIHLVGDSILLGGRKTLGRVTRSVPHRVQRAIPEMVVTSYARGGWSVSVQKGMVVAPLHPDGLLTQLLPTDVVVLMLGVNDFSASAPLAVFEQFYRNLLGKTGELGVSIICVTPISAAKEDRRNALGLTLEAYRVAIRNLCSNAGLAVVEGPQLLPYDPRYYADGRHPAGLGALLLARRLAAAIRESVPSLREPQLAPGRYGAADFDAPPAPGNDALFE